MSQSAGERSEPSTASMERTHVRQDTSLFEDQKDGEDRNPAVVPHLNSHTAIKSEDGFVNDDESEEEINDTAQLIPTADLKQTSAKHKFKIYEGSEENLNFKQLEKHVKLKRFVHWFLGVSTLDGIPIAMETQEERELQMQKKLKVSSCANGFIIFNWCVVIGVHFFLYALYW